jgi:hypothetical protein
MFSLNWCFIFLFLPVKIFLVLRFVVQFSEFRSTYYQLLDAQVQVIPGHHVTSLRPVAHERIFSPPQSKQLAL